MNCPVTICIPVRNEEALIQKVIDSSVRQTYRPLEILVLDNASTDNTLLLSSKCAQRNPEIQIHSHPTNIGAWQNFMFGLFKAKGKYFCWLAADDSKSPNFVARCVEFLEANPDYVGVTGIEHFGDSIRTSEIIGEDRATRIQEFFDVSWHAHGLFYGVFRTETLRRIPTFNGSYFAVDWGTLLWSLAHGKIRRLPDISIDIGTDGVSSGPHRFAYPRPSVLSWIQPFESLQRDVLSWPEWSAAERMILRRGFVRKNLQILWWQLGFQLGKLKNTHD